MDSEDFFSTISQFLVQFKKTVQERLPRTPAPRLVIRIVTGQHITIHSYTQSPCNKECNSGWKCLQTTPRKEPRYGNRYLG